jgi:hypothetical protein
MVLVAAVQDGFKAAAAAAAALCVCHGQELLLRSIASIFVVASFTTVQLAELAVYCR